MTEAGRNLLTQAGHAGHLLVDELKLTLQTVPDRIRAATVLGGHVSPRGPCCQLLGVKHLPDLREREAEQLLQLLDAFNPLESGFVSREPGEDLRAVRISITRPGEEAVTRLLAAGQRILRAVLAGWDAADRDELSRLLCAC